MSLVNWKGTMTRRDFIVSAIGASAMPVLPHQVRSSVGARMMANAEEQDTTKYTASDYVMDGLITLYDGIENAGFGMHDDESPTWADLSGNGFDVTMDFSHGEWVSNGVKCHGTGKVGARLNCRDEYLAKGFTYAPHMEVVCDWRKGPGNWFFIFSLPLYGSTYQSFCGSYRDYIGINGMKRAPVALPDANVVTSFSCSERIMTQNGIDMGAAVSSTSLGWVRYDITIGGNESDVYRYELGNIYCIRAYSRELTDDEMLWNLEVDKDRYRIGRPS